MTDAAIKERIALAFLGVLGKWLEQDSQGLFLDAEFVENANDWFDANMAMDEAFKSVGIDPLGGGSMEEETVALWNASWARAVEIQRGRDAA